MHTGETPGGDERRSWEAGGPGQGADSGRPGGKGVGAGDKGNPGRVARGRGEEAGEGTAGSDPGRLERGARGGHVVGTGGGLRPGVSPSRCWKGGIPGFSPFWRLRGPRVLAPAPASRSPDWWKILTSTAVKAAAGFGAGAGGAVTEACGPALPSGLDRGRRGRTDWDAETGDGAAASLPGGGRQPTDLSHPSRLGGLGTGGGFFWEWVLFTS